MNKKAGHFLFLFLGVVIFTSLLLQYFLFPAKPETVRQESSSKVAGVSIAKDNSISSSPSPIKLTKDEYVIALFGDSMIDTMGEKMEFLDRALQKKYPSTAFRLYNYGIGAQNVEQGLSRWDSSFKNRERSFPPISRLFPDVIILGSYAYNPFHPHDLQKYRNTLLDLVQKAKETKAKVYLLAEIAPLYDGFGEGSRGPNMSTESAHMQANNIREQLEQVATVAKKQKVMLIDMFSITQFNGKYGNRYYTNPDDGIHPSDFGQEETAKQIVEIIKFD
ncbi:MAG TPA: GDSL-type esterase/lipase family protein [Candidatus Levybacteria bacterium]|nr:GDSL-type esterase/lipase family protein [Candidatus Levybacteria bacterium]